MSLDTTETITQTAESIARTRSTLPGRDYHAPEIFELERERIFHDRWMCVGREEQVADRGDYLVEEIIDESIIVVRDRSGNLNAFYNVCRHRGSKLCDEADGNFGGAIRCPYHAWSYSFEGQLKSTPNIGDVEGFDRNDFPLYSVAVDTWEGFIFVNLASEPASLADQLRETGTDFARYRIGDLRIGGVIEYDVAANWKIITENYMECLHCPSVHPELCKIVPIYKQGIVREVEGSWGNSMVDGATTFTPTGSSNRPTLPDLTEKDITTYFGAFAFPNLILNLHSDHVMTYRLKDITPERTTVISEFLFEPKTIDRSDFDPKDVVEFWDLVSRQDWEVCERVQKGIRSRAYQGGFYPPQDDFALEFNQRYLQERDR